jgi:hypothetical protein
MQPRIGFSPKALCTTKNPLSTIEKPHAEYHSTTSTSLDLGLCKGILSHCPVPGRWQFCPYRHWAPEPMELRWMDQKWLERNEVGLRDILFRRLVVEWCIGVWRGLIVCSGRLGL